MLIPGREKRIAFLRQLRSLVTDGAPVLLSFFAAEDNNRHLQRVARIANIFRRILRRPLVEVGDDLVPNLVHYCSEESVAAELKSAGFELAFYNVTDYGHAVAHSVRVAGEKPTVPSNRAPVTAAAPKLNR
jgi:hypothetical protein